MWVTMGSIVSLTRTSTIDEAGIGDAVFRALDAQDAFGTIRLIEDVHRYRDRMPSTAVGASSTGVTGIEGIKEE